MNESKKGKPQPRHSEEIKEKARMLFKQGMSGNDIAEKMGLNPSTVYAWIKDKPFNPKPVMNYTQSALERANALEKELEELKYKHRMILQLLKT